MIGALQGQRDRYMKLAKDREQEMLILKARLDRSLEEQMGLKSENMELYKRIRTVRAGSRQGLHMGGRAGGHSNYGTPSKARSRKGERGTMKGVIFDDEECADMDALDRKYSELYEVVIPAIASKSCKYTY